MTKANFEGPHWDNGVEYKDLTAAEFVVDLEKLRRNVERLKEQSTLFDEELARVTHLSGSDLELIEAAVRMRRLADETFVLGANLGTYVSCLLSLNGGHTQARNMQAILRQLMTRLEESLTSIELIMTQAPDGFVSSCLSRAEFQPHLFSIQKQREWRPYLLSLEEEKVLTRFSVNGPDAWGTLYDNIASSLRCEVKLDGQDISMGLARAAGCAQSAHPLERLAGYRAVEGAWSTQKEACASILNALAGWRLDEYKTRSKNNALHFLDRPLHESRIRRSTLDAMMHVVEKNLEVGRSALRLKARELNCEKLGPWDLFAPVPEQETAGETKKISFDDAVELIRDAFADVDPEMGQFVELMVKNRWIEGTVGDSKRPGAYCTRFAKSRTPRVYMTYKGTMEDVGTLAHELGHAFHNWVMRDLPLPETWYPMTLAETASIFAETVVSDVMLKRAPDPVSRRKILWGDLGSAESFLLNIPARFWFESDFYDKRQERTLSPDEFSELMSQAWKRAYGNELSEMNSMFWCSKLHFHISGTSFYNYPYTFGYLFSLGVYAQRERQGKDFYTNYVQLLRDTGRMGAEELARKYLNVDLGQEEFWQASVNMVKRQIENYVALV
ncbi:MAG: M3 family oligoendopeptidase [Betaproteobacteria bacterium]|nr:M3 family oligoendopeptidase [Betaproteobacteria bacterium]